MSNEAPPITTGSRDPRPDDHVYPARSDETWVVGRVQDRHVYPFGWPPTTARLIDCEVVYCCSGDEHAKALVNEVRREVS